MKQVSILIILMITGGFAEPLIATAQQKTNPIKSDPPSLAASVNVKDYGARPCTWIP